MTTKTCHLIGRTNHDGTYFHAVQTDLTDVDGEVMDCDWFWTDLPDAKHVDAALVAAQHQGLVPEGSVLGHSYQPNEDPEVQVYYSIEVPTLTRSEFAEHITEALDSPDVDDDDRKAFDVDAAWAAYQADPAQWHKVTQDNPSGAPGAAFVLADGPWWRTP